MKNKRTSTAVQRWGRCALTLLLACALLAGLAITAFARGNVVQGEVVDPAIPKPTVTIQGNLVVDKPGGKPTGFYELALCVRSGRTIVGPVPNDWTNSRELTEAEYAQALEFIENGTAPAGITQDSYALTYYPFRTATAAVNINADVLTAVDWAIQNVTYETYDAATQSYPSDPGPMDPPTPGYHPRGIDTDPEVQGYDDLGLTASEAFPDITTPNLDVGLPSVAIDVEGDSRMFAATGQVDHYDAATSTALLTLSAQAPSNRPIILTQDTPLVVARFSYDLKRFSDVKVNDTDWVTDKRNDATGDPVAAGFWLGWDKTTGVDYPVDTKLAGKTPLTWLGQSDPLTVGNYDFTDSDEQAAATRMGQSVWVHMETGSDKLDDLDTYFYYYLGAESYQNVGQKTQKVDVNGVPTDVPGITVPKTAGTTVLTEGTDQNPDPATASPAPSPAPSGPPATQAQYTYFKNLLRLEDRSLVVKLVNDVTFKKPAGVGGNQILFYDWDDKLIGALIVGNGDVRSEVNEYVEKNFVHPDLRSSTILSGGELGGNLPDFTVVPAPGTDAEKYTKLLTSLDREWTYRGEHDSVYGGGAGSVTYPEKGQPGYDETKAGSSYPLTNKLDYAFYKRLNTVTSVDTADPVAGKSWTERYFKVDDLTADPDAALYPWAYGWAIVADPDNHTLSTKSAWPVMVDSDKLESTWTTFGSGELADQTPGGGNVLNGFATPSAVTPPATNPTVTYPGGLSADWSTDPLYQDPQDYAYKTSSADANGYLRFADFSDLDKMFLPDQNVLVVKAVYEPGANIDLLGNYTVVENSLDVRRYSTTASTQNGVYSFAFQYQRGWDTSGTTPYVGVRRVRDPAMKTSFVFDAKSVDETIDLSKQGQFLVQNLADGDGNFLNVDLTSSGDLWSMGYNLVERYGTNFANGANRSKPDELGELIKKNFIYDDDTPKYDERQGTDGFVVQLTLITLLEEASKDARGESNNLTNHSALATVRDLNFKRAAGDPPTEFSAANASRVANYLRDLVKRLYDDGVSIDPRTDNVTLTWHQVQRHILMCEASGGTPVPGIYSGGVLMSDGQCAGFAWCRMDECAGDVKMDINSVNDVLKALYMIDTINDPSDVNYKKAYEAIYGDGSPTSTGVTAATLKDYGFRIRSEGVPYDPTLPDAALKTAILDDLTAVTRALAAAAGSEPDWATVTWAQIQTEIIKDNMGASAPATMNFWWKDGTPPAINNWEDLLTYSYHAWVGVDFDGDGTPEPNGKVPDAFDSFTNAKVNKDLLDAMIKEHVHGNDTGDYANMGWLRHSVDSNGEAVEFTDAEQFATAWKAALEVLAKPTAQGGGGYDTVDELKSITWEELQYAILTGQYKSYADIMAAVNDGTLDHMYWNDGGQPKLTFDKLLDAVNEYYFSGGSVSTKLDKLLVKGVDPVNNQVYLRKDDGGSSFNDVAEFKNAVYNAMAALQYSTFNGGSFIDTSGDTSKLVVDEYELQYMLIHYADFGSTILNMPTSAQIQADHTADETVNNYWWFDGGAPSGAMPIRNIKELFTAYFWYKGPSMGVLGQNPDALNRLDAAVMQTVGLRGDTMGIPYQSITTAQVVAALDKLPYSAATLATASDADLMKELQYVLLTGSYAPAGSITDDYWWQSATGAYPAPTDQESLLKAAWAAYIGDGAGTVVPEAVTALDGVDPAWVSAREGGLALRRDTDGKDFPDLDRFKAMLEPAIQMLADPARGGKDYDHLGAADVTQRQLQYFLLDPSTYQTDAYVQSVTIDTSTDPVTDDYWWFTSDKKPGTGPVIEEKPIDQGTWYTFLDNLNAVLMGLGDGTEMDYVTLDLLQNTFHLRASADGSLATDLSAFYDGSGADLLTNAVYALSTAHMEYWDENDFTIKTYPTWYEFQYAMLHADDIMNNGSMPDATDLADAGQTDFPWRFETSGPVTPSEPEEKPIDQGTWYTFLDNLNAVLMGLGDGTEMDYVTLDLLQNTFHLRASADGSLATNLSAFYDGSGADLLTNAVYALSTAHMEYWDENDFTIKTYPTWYEFQYAMLHADDVMNNGSMPDATELEDNGQTDFPWRFTGLEAGASLFQADEDGKDTLADMIEAIETGLPELQERNPGLAEKVAEVLTELKAEAAKQPPETETPLPDDTTPATDQEEVRPDPVAPTPTAAPDTVVTPTPEPDEPAPAPEPPAIDGVTPEPEPEPTPEPDIVPDVPDDVTPDVPAETEEVPLGEDATPATIAIWKPQCDWRTALAA